eukprot:2270747-Amphidinium_carterae.1
MISACDSPGPRYFSMKSKRIMATGRLWQVSSLLQDPETKQYSKISCNLPVWVDGRGNCNLQKETPTLVNFQSLSRSLSWLYLAPFSGSGSERIKQQRYNATACC